VIELQRGHKLTQSRGLEMPDGFDPSGIPCVDSGRTHRRRTSSHRQHGRALPGLAPTSVIASVEVLESAGADTWLVWGCAGDRPVLFAVEAGAAAEMLNALRSGEVATAIVEPGQLLLERLD
jgi:hypothetical protein